MTTSRLEEKHPSFLALDRAGLGELSPDMSQHLDGCAECRSYVQSLGEAPLASSLVEIRGKLVQRRRRTLRAWWAALPVAAAACGLIVLSLNPQPDLPLGPRNPPPYVAAKGFLSVWIYVKHGPNTELWDGKKPVSVGDQLRLKVDPGSFRRVEVYSVKPPAAPTLLYSGRVVPGQSATLPEAWEVDAEPGAERLVVAFSNEAVKPVWPDWLQGKLQPGVSVLPFTLPKSPSTDPDAGSTSP